MIDFSNSEDIFPKRPKPHKIDAKASGILRNAIPDDWIINEIHNDYGVDYIVEISVNDSPQGLSFYIQQKGIEECQFGTDNKYHLKVKQSSLNFWIASPIPVLITIVDIKNIKVYCTWVEEAYEDYPEFVTGQKHKTILIKQNDLFDIEVQSNILTVLKSNRDDKLKREISASTFSKLSGMPKSDIKNILSKQPSISAILELWEKADSSFSYEVLSKEKKLFVIVNPKSTEPIPIAMIESPDQTTKTKIDKLLDYGETARLSPNEIQLIGPKSLETLFPGFDVQEITIQRNVPEIDSQVIMKGISTCKSKEVLVIFNMEFLSMGRKEAALKLWLKGFPVTFIIKFNPDFEEDALPALDYSVDLSSCCLDAALKGLRLLEILENGGDITVKFASNDKQLFALNTKSNCSNYRYNKSIELVEVLIKVNNRFNAHIKYPDFSCEEENRSSLYNLSLAYQVVNQGIFELPIEDKYTITTLKETLYKLAEIDWTDEKSVINYTIQDYHLRIFNDDLSMGQCSVRLPRFKPRMGKEEIIKIANDLMEGESTDIIFMYDGDDGDPIAIHEFNVDNID